jgi:hypothetical protein
MSLLFVVGPTASSTADVSPGIAAYAIGLEIAPDR